MAHRRKPLSSVSFSGYFRCFRGEGRVLPCCCYQFRWPRLSVGICPLIAIRRQRFVNQISVSRANINDTEAGFAGTTRRCGKGRSDILNTFDRERLRRRIVLGENQCAWGNDVVPTPHQFRGPFRGLPTAGRCWPCDRHAPTASQQRCLAHG
jgi:hypothetical protein